MAREPVGPTLRQRERPCPTVKRGNPTVDRCVEPDQSPSGPPRPIRRVSGGHLGQAERSGDLGNLRRLVRLVMAVVAAGCATACHAEDGAPASGEPVAAVTRRFTVSGTAGSRVVEGLVVREALDGGALVESADGRLELLDPATIVAREDLAAEPPLAARDVARRVLAELPAGFDVVITKHYVVCYDTSRGYAQWCAGLFERLHEAFVNFWRHAGLDLPGAERPLVVVVFADRERYEAFAAGDLGAAADRVVGYYNLLSNRVTTYDLTGRDGPGGRGGSPGRAGLEILASPEAGGLVSTLVHEATHQMAFNAGLHRRLAPVPLWVSEGIATYFETPDLASGRGWRGIGGVNRPRADRIVAAGRAPRLGALIADDAPFRDPDTALDAYAASWALTAMLVQTRKAEFVRYLGILAAKPPLADDSPGQRRADFEAAFGATPEAFEEPLARFAARWR